eukprot:TRINITY_DN1200_c0_g1_i4.p1 TRINITY_DN1200_c0_g1~~TRINITY_DN1200_c0_g1_i4.p1  ORF type:complete len:289 (-),score=69.70 TRINITY_DN1200_c0_g1_i4:294-1160(-)
MERDRDNREHPTNQTRTAMDQYNLQESLEGSLMRPRYPTRVGGVASPPLQHQYSVNTHLVSQQIEPQKKKARKQIKHRDFEEQERHREKQRERQRKYRKKLKQRQEQEKEKERELMASSGELSGGESATTQDGGEEKSKTDEPEVSLSPSRSPSSVAVPEKKEVASLNNSPERKTSPRSFRSRDTEEPKQPQINFVNINPHWQRKGPVTNTSSNFMPAPSLLPSGGNFVPPPTFPSLGSNFMPVSNPDHGMSIFALNPGHKQIQNRSPPLSRGLTNPLAFHQTQSRKY